MNKLPFAKPRKIISKLIKILTLLLFLFLSVYIIINIGSINIKETVEGLGLWGPFGIFILRFTSVIIPAMPSTAYSILAGTMFGFQKGIFIICLSDLISCTTSFLISRRFGRSIVIRLVGNNFMSKVEKLSKRHFENNFFLMTGFLMTGLFDFVSYAIGLTKTPVKRFIPALILSIALSNPPVVALGAGLLTGGKKFIFIGLVGIFILAIISSKINKQSPYKQL